MQNFINIHQSHNIFRLFTRKISGSFIFFAIGKINRLQYSRGINFLELIAIFIKFVRQIISVENVLLELKGKKN